MSDLKTPKILAFAGSLRRASWNRKLLNLAVTAARSAGAEVELIDLNEHELPLFSEDLEAEGIPHNLVRLRDLFVEADGLMIATPEYNGSISAVLKNTLDWLSRPPMHGESYEPAYKGKGVALMATSPGRLGGSRGIKHVHEILHNLGCHVCAGEVTLASASHAFNDDGTLIDSEAQQSVITLAENIVAQLRET